MFQLCECTNERANKMDGVRKDLKNVGVHRIKG